MIAQNLALISKSIEEAAKKAGRGPKDITLVSVTKQATNDQIREAISEGISDIGENRVQDALLKYSQLQEMAGKVNWHLIGHLQTNKVKKALEIFSTIHSLDSLKLAEEIDQRASSLAKRIDCFVEVNVSGESSKHGIDPAKVEEFIVKAARLPQIHIIGLMTMAPFVDDPELARPYFKRLRFLRDDLQKKNIANTHIRELSMGMTQDFEVAIEEGATFIRVGTAVFK